MKYILVVFYMTTNWPMPAAVHWAQLGPFDNILACEAAAGQAELITKELGATRVGTFCAGTKEGYRIAPGAKHG